MANCRVYKIKEKISNTKQGNFYHFNNNDNNNLPSRRNSVFGFATGYGLDDRGVRVRVRLRLRISSTSSRPALGSTWPPLQCVPGALSPGIKRPLREADHSTPASAEVKKMWIYTSIPPIRFHGVVLNLLSWGTTLPYAPSRSIGQQVSG
jgi:hypothetical protein